MLLMVMAADGQLVVINPVTGERRRSCKKVDAAW
jgi:hypothetical protein